MAADRAEERGDLYLIDEVIRRLLRCGWAVSGTSVEEPGHDGQFLGRRIGDWRIGKDLESASEVPLRLLAGTTAPAGLPNEAGSPRQQVFVNPVLGTQQLSEAPARGSIASDRGENGKSLLASSEVAEDWLSGDRRIAPDTGRSSTAWKTRPR